MIAYNKSRLTIVFMLFGLIWLVAWINLFLIQVVQHEYFANLAQRQYHVSITTRPPRAAIYDRNHEPLALNKKSVAAFITPRTLRNRKAVTNFLQQNFPAAAQRLGQSGKKHFMYVKRRLSDMELERIEQAEIDDIKLLKEASRYYPCPAAGAIVGLTGTDNTGLFGIEQTFNNQLAGQPTTVTLEKDGRNGQYYICKETQVAGAPSSSLTLTIDSALQFLVTDALKQTVQQFGASEATAVVMDPANGDIIVLAQYPTFDPNNTGNLDISRTKNHCITESYELGSVIKTCAALAALDAGVVQPTELIDCENTRSTLIDGMRVNTVYPAGVIPFWRVMQMSNNIGIAKVAQRLGTQLYDYYTRMGFGSKTGIRLTGEQAGFVNPPRNWSKQSILSLSYGYEIRANLLQLARFFCMIANGGKDVKPRLVLNSPIKMDKIFESRAIRIMQKILERTVPPQAQIDGYRVMGKTGTANLLVDGKYDENKNIYTFAGIIQKGGYRRVIVTFVKESDRKNVYASQVAAPLFKKIAQALLIHDRMV